MVRDRVAAVAKWVEVALCLIVLGAAAVWISDAYGQEINVRSAA